jgi:hypothetical protein
MIGGGKGGWQQTSTSWSYNRLFSSLVCVAIALVDDIFEVKRCVKCGCKLDCK